MNFHNDPDFEPEQSDEEKELQRDEMELSQIRCRKKKH